MKAANSPRTACDHPRVREEASLTAFCICAAYDGFTDASLNIAQREETGSRYVGAGRSLHRVEPTAFIVSIHGLLGLGDGPNAGYLVRREPRFHECCPHCVQQRTR